MEARIDRIAGDFAILKLSDSQEIKWPTKMLPSDYKIGMTVWLNLATSSPPPKMNQKDSLKDVLNEILKEDSTVS